MERTLKIVLVAAVSILTVIGLGAVAYAQTTGTSAAGQCGSTMGGGGMGNMDNMMGQSSCTQANCQSMMGRDTAQCQNMASRNMGQCAEIMSQQNTAQACH